ncbi:DUF3108 domain-containing protein [Sulfuricurvum sp.]|uniref:DUF3108 domain-containing protein n=1 Tax=Sulfuricurvum sp. TaxID=2025608 RepID=UPI002D63C310|nr:DUF3108 domain-containing protein [Sulfuricurvum sp.]HZF70819.1 DUF3108 domain-containing protein [Sulfuricurvum sp.]
MKKIVLLLLVLSQIAGAKVLTATYEVSFGIFQTMGIANARMEIKDDQTYTIHIDAKTTGIAKVLSGNRIEIYDSRGTVKNGKLIPDTYSKVRQTNSKKVTKIYTFDHTNKVVWKETIEGKERNKEVYDFYAPEDILTLFFNIGLYTQARQDKVLHAIGGSGKDGRIDVVFPNPKALKEMQKEMDTEDGDFMKVVLNDRIFSSANGELLINLSRDGLCNKAVLEDVLLFGDIVGVRVR